MSNIDDNYEEPYVELSTKQYSLRDTSYSDRLIFKKPVMVAELSLGVTFIIVGAILATLMIDFLVKQGESILPIIFATLVIAVIVSLPLILSGSKIKSIEINYDSIVIKNTLWGGHEISLNDYIRVIPIRHYNKKHGYYMRTTYQLLINNNGKQQKINLFDMNPVQASELIYELDRAKNKTTNIMANPASVADRVFNWEPDYYLPKKNDILSWIFSGIVLGAPLSVVIIGMFSHYGVSVAAVLVTLFFLIIVSLLIIMCGESYKRTAFYRASKIEELVITPYTISIDSLTLRYTDIQEIQISYPDQGDPKCGKNSVFLIITNNKLYKYITYTPDSVRGLTRRSITNPNWDYQDFYYSIYNWCKANNVKVMDYMV